MKQTHIHQNSYYSLHVESEHSNIILLYPHHYQMQQTHFIKKKHNINKTKYTCDDMNNTNINQSHKIIIKHMHLHVFFFEHQLQLYLL